MSNIQATLHSIFGILFIFSSTFTAYAQQEQQPAALSQSQFEKILEKIEESEDKMRTHVDKKFGELDEKLGELDEKFDELDKQVAVPNTKEANVYFNRGFCKKKLGRAADANQDFQKALSLAQEAGDTELIATIKKHI